MATRKPTSVPEPEHFPYLILHEIDNSALKHRIVIVDADGSSAGQWTTLDNLAVYDEYRANVEIDKLPEGVFTVSEISYKSLLS